MVEDSHYGCATENMKELRDTIMPIWGKKNKKKHNPPRLHKYLGKCVKPTDVLTVLPSTSEVAYNRQMVHDDHLTT